MKNDNLKSKKKILITGTNGMLGKDIFFELYNNDYVVFGVDLKKNPLLPLQFQKIGDLTEKNFTHSILEEINPDIIIHCAAIVNLNTCQNNKTLAHAVHVGVTKWLAKFKPKETKLIYISTDSVFDGKKGNYTESDIPNPLNYYAESKLEGENAAKQNPNHVIIRTNIFGFNIPLKNSLAEWAIKNFMENKSITGFEDVLFSAIYTEQLAEKILKLVDIDFKGTINIASKDFMTKYEFLTLLAETAEFSKDFVKKGKTTDFGSQIKRPLNTTLDVSKALSLFELPFISEGVNMLVNNIKINKTKLL